VGGAALALDELNSVFFDMTREVRDGLQGNSDCQVSGTHNDNRPLGVGIRLYEAATAVFDKTAQMVIRV
jgi:hypothetical protein